MNDGIAEHLGRTDLTTLALFSVTHTKDGTIDTKQTGYKRITGAIGKQLIREAHDNAASRSSSSTRASGTARNERFFASTTVQDATIEALVALAVRIGVDGINVDVERLGVDLVPAYGAFVARLGIALRGAIPDGAGLGRDDGRSDRCGDGGCLGGRRGRPDLPDGLRLPLRRAPRSAHRRRWIAATARTQDLVWSSRSVRVGRRAGREDGPRAAAVRDALASRRARDRRAAARRRGDLGPGGQPAVPGRPAGRRPSSTRSRSSSSTRSRRPSAPSRAIRGATAGWQAIYVDSPRTLAPKLALADDRGLAGAGFLGDRLRARPVRVLGPDRPLRVRQAGVGAAHARTRSDERDRLARPAR